MLGCKPLTFLFLRPSDKKIDMLVGMGGTFTPADYKKKSVPQLYSLTVQKRKGRCPGAM